MVKVFTLEIAHHDSDNGPLYHIHGIYESRMAANLALENIECAYSDINEFEVQSADFIQFIKHVSKEVDTWPEWKKQMGVSSQEHFDRGHRDE